MQCAILGVHEGEVLSFSPRTHRLPWDWEHVAGRRGDRVARFKGPPASKSH